MMLGNHREEKSLNFDATGRAITRCPVKGKFPKLPSGGLGDELYFMEDRFCNDPSLSHPGQSFFIISVCNHLNSHTNPRCLEPSCQRYGLGVPTPPMYMTATKLSG
jgi:hypothetical protein